MHVCHEISNLKYRITITWHFEIFLKNNIGYKKQTNKQTNKQLYFHPDLWKKQRNGIYYQTKYELLLM